MGMLILLCGVAGFIIGGPLVVIGVVVNKVREKMIKHDTWMAFLAISAFVCLVMAGVGFDMLRRGNFHSSSGDWYEDPFKGIFIIGLSPGVGLLLGAVIMYAVSIAHKLLSKTAATPQAR